MPDEELVLLARERVTRLCRDRAIADREQEIAAVNAAYTQAIERFSMLLDMVEFRRAKSVQDDDNYQDPRR